MKYCKICNFLTSILKYVRKNKKKTKKKKLNQYLFEFKRNRDMNN